MKVKVRCLVLVVCIMLLVAAGCGPAADKPEPGQPAEPVFKELIVGHHLDPTHLNPVDTTTAGFQSVHAQIIEELVIFSADGSTIEPWLVTEWDWVDDVTLEMKLREGITFSNGEPFDAESVQYTMDRFAETPRYGFLLPRDVYRETEIMDTYTVRVHLERPFAGFMDFLARGASALPPKYYEEVGLEGYGEAPIGTGPFILTEWVKDSHLVLERREDYWNGPHPINRVVFRVIPEETSRVAALETGEIDIALMMPVGAIERVNRNPDTEAIAAPGSRKFAVHFDTIFTDNPALADPRVRIALNMAVDKETICQSVFGGAADPLQGQWMLPTEVGFNPDISLFPYDADRARELMAEAGYPDGFDFRLTWTIGRYAQDKELGEAVASYIQQAGVRVDQNAMEYGAYIELWRANTVGSHLWGLAYPPSPFTNYNSFTEGTIYEFHHLGARFTELVNEMSTMPRSGDQDRIGRQLAEIMHNDPPCLYLIVPRDIYGVNNRVQGFEPRLSQVLWLYDVDVE